MLHRKPEVKRWWAVLDALLVAQIAFKLPNSAHLQNFQLKYREEHALWNVEDGIGNGQRSQSPRRNAQTMVNLKFDFNLPSTTAHAHPRVNLRHHQTQMHRTRSLYTDSTEFQRNCSADHCHRQLLSKHVGSHLMRIVAFIASCMYRCSNLPRTAWIEGCPFDDPC